MERFSVDEEPVNSTPENGGGSDYGDGDEEALSLCDLPLIHQSRIQIDEEEIRSRQPVEAQEDFDFCALSKESEMCAADEVFFQGQILPLRHSVSSGDGLSILNGSISMSRSMDCCDSAGLFASRSSSISSRQSSSSGSSAAADDCKSKKPLVNLFHSHPSPSPKLKRIARNISNNNNNRNSTNKSSAWSIFRLGLIATPPKIVFQDAKTRTNGRNCSNRNSTGSNNDKKKQPRANFLGGCDCSLRAVDTVPSKVVVIKRSGSDGQTEKLQEKRVSPNRTFEWLKLLSIEGAPEVTVLDE